MAKAFDSPRTENVGQGTAFRAVSEVWLPLEKKAVGAPSIEGAAPLRKGSVAAPYPGVGSRRSG